MTGLTTLTFILAAVLILIACVPADRVRSWRESLNPSAPDIPDAAFTVTRLLLVVLAGFGIYYGFQGRAAEDNMSWSDNELTSAVQAATESLDGGITYGAPLDDGQPADFDGQYSIEIEQEITEHGGGDAPGYGVTADITGAPTANEAHYRITADGAGTSFCMHVKQTHEGYVETVAPGFSGDAAVVREPKYTYAVSSRVGEC
ncbi:hypothetical protein AB0K93_19210 [Streptomyces sp. NPDC052676]|uniref:hypothetical protein n=1 Tax=Streptomyces sp. NPDC052676 TaxID=3154953 RepID=UPI00341FCC61